MSEVLWNAADAGSGIVLSDADKTAASSGGWYVVRATARDDAGKRYFEVVLPDSPSVYVIVGVASENVSLSGYVGGSAESWGYQTGGYKRNAGDYEGGYGGGESAGDVLMCAYDLAAGKIWWGKNGSWFAGGDPETGANPAYSNLSGTLYPAISPYTTARGTLRTVEMAYAPAGYAAPSVIQPPSGRVLTGLAAAHPYDGGRQRVRGTITELGVPGPYRVRLFDRRTGRLLRETWSAADGAYQFAGIAYRPQGYVVVAHDRGADPLNAAIADLVTPEPMP